MELKTKVSKASVLRSPKKVESLKPFAIPEGRYAVVISYSPKFKAWLPVLLGGPDFNHLFKGIRIHAGNTAEDTAGCILVGRNQQVGRLFFTQSQTRHLIIVRGMTLSFVIIVMIVSVGESGCEMVEKRLELELWVNEMCMQIEENVARMKVNGRWIKGFLSC